MMNMLQGVGLNAWIVKSSPEIFVMMSNFKTDRSRACPVTYTHREYPCSTVLDATFSDMRVSRHAKNTFTNSEGARGLPSHEMTMSISNQCKSNAGGVWSIY